MAIGDKMHARRLLQFVIGILLMPAALANHAATEPSDTSVMKTYGSLPPHFEPNLGQFHPDVVFQARAAGYTFFLTPTEAVFVVNVPGEPGEDVPSAAPSPEPQGPMERTNPSGVDAPQALHAVRMGFVGAQLEPRITGEGEHPGKSNYFLGNDPAEWVTSVPHHDRVLVEDLWPGIHMVFYGTPERSIQYDFLVDPGADPARIRLAFEGASPELQNGSLLLTSDGAPLLRFPAPYSYQVTRGLATVASAFDLEGNGVVGFRVGEYDRGERLVIDPAVVPAYSTYLGGNGDDGADDVAVDALGNAYIVGSTRSLTFPTSAGAFQRANAGGNNAFVTKLNPDGTGIVYSTYLGGGAWGNWGQGIVVDAGGNAYISGTTEATNFPVTLGAYQTAKSGGYDAFVAKLNPTGSGLVYSTYLGGNNWDVGRSIAVDSSGSAYIAGETYSTNFPTTAGAFQTVAAGDLEGFVTKLNAAGSGLMYSTYLGGGGHERAVGIALYSNGMAYVTGYTVGGSFPTTVGAYQVAGGGSYDAFVTKLNAAGSGLVYSTHLGGSSIDLAEDIAIDAGGSAYVTGATSSTNFPTTPGAYQSANAGDRDVFVAKLNAAGSGLAYGTYLGGNNEDWGQGIALDRTGNAYATGYTRSTDFLTTPGAFQGVNPLGADAFVTKLDAVGSDLVYSTYLGGSASDWGGGITVDGHGNAYVVGSTSSIDFPIFPGFQPVNVSPDAYIPIVGVQPYDAFVAKLIIPHVAPYLETFEPGLARGWVLTGLWHVSNCRGTSPLHSLAYNRPLLTCPSNFNTGGQTFGDAVSPPIDIPGSVTSAVLRWESWHGTEPGTVFDQKVVYVTNNGGVTWTQVWQEGGPQATWNSRSVDLSAYAGSTVNVRFHFDSVDGVSNNGEGWFVDDVRLAMSP